MIGPLPPPVGGVANFVQNILAYFSSHEKYDIEVIRTGEKGPRVQPLSQLLHDMRQFLRFAIKYKRYNAEIIHIHTSSYYSFLRNVPYFFWARYLSDAQVVVHLHGGMFREFYNSTNALVKSLIRWMLRSADAVIVTSPSWIDLIKEISGRDGSFFALANGFEPSIFHPMDRQESRRRIGLKDGGKMLVSVGYLENVKGHKYLIEAMPEVKEYYDNSSLYIIGSGSLKNELLSQVKQLGLEGTVNIIEKSQTPEEVALWIGSSDLFVLPSLNEGNPTVLFECLGCGRPFLGTRVGGVADVITSEELGSLADPADSKGLAVSMISMLGKEWDEDRIAVHAQQYSWSMISASLAGIYDRMLETVR
jgi:glycosyltransferase involved in cell wall biosynthesis